MDKQGNTFRENPLTGWPEIKGRDEYEYSDELPEFYWPSIEDVIDVQGMSTYQKPRKKWEGWRQLSLFDSQE